jgi:NifB/MoaA-like Fe-S oxidoreductase
MSKNVIIDVDECSVCSEMGVEPGDILLSINNMPVQDVFDYRYLTQEDSFDMLIRKKRRRGMAFGDRKKRR